MVNSMGHLCLEHDLAVPEITTRCRKASCECFKKTFHIGDSHVPDLESDLTMGWVQDPLCLAHILTRMKAVNIVYAAAMAIVTDHHELKGPPHPEQAFPDRSLLRRRSALLGQVHLGEDSHLVSHQHAAGLKHRVRGEAELLAVDPTWWSLWLLFPCWMLLFQVDNRRIIIRRYESE